MDTLAENFKKIVESFRKKIARTKTTTTAIKQLMQGPQFVQIEDDVTAKFTSLLRKHGHGGDPN